MGYSRTQSRTLRYSSHLSAKRLRLLSKLPIETTCIYGEPRAMVDNTIALEHQYNSALFGYIPKLINARHRYKDYEYYRLLQAVLGDSQLIDRLLTYTRLDNDLLEFVMYDRPIHQLTETIQEFADTVNSRIEILQQCKPKVLLKARKLYRKTIQSATKLYKYTSDFVAAKSEQDAMLSLLEPEVPGITQYVSSKMENNIDVPMYMKGDLLLSKQYSASILIDILDDTNKLISGEEVQSNKLERIESLSLPTVAQPDRREVVQHPLVGSEIVRGKLSGHSNFDIATKLGLTANDVSEFWKYYLTLSDDAKGIYSQRNIFNWQMRLQEHFNDLWDDINNLEEFTVTGEINEQSQELALDYLGEILSTIDQYQSVLASVSSSTNQDVFSHHVDEYLMNNLHTSKLPGLLLKINNYKNGSLLY